MPVFVTENAGKWDTHTLSLSLSARNVESSEIFYKINYTSKSTSRRIERVAGARRRAVARLHRTESN